MLYILWDESHIWGLLAARAAKGLGIAHRLVRAGRIAEGLLDRARPSMLLVPGGNARHKADALGPRGLAAIQEYVASGGQYFGFCGGAGLALTWEGGLRLCPWTRAGYDDRMQHFMSGHLHISLPGTFTRAQPDAISADSLSSSPAAPALASPLVPPGLSASPLLPVWWPGRFEPDEQTGITILATYEKPGDDFWLADLPIASLPPDTFSVWQDMYGVSLSPSFLAGQPCLLHGAYGKGGYTLSYSHLETPASSEANYWFAHLLHHLAGLVPQKNEVPAWDLHLPEPAGSQGRAQACADVGRFSDCILSTCSPVAASFAAPLVGEEDGAASDALPFFAWTDADLVHFFCLMRDMLRTGLAHGLLFQRNPWLMGWRTGIPGASLNNLWAALVTILELPPTPAAMALWDSRRAAVMAAATLFHKGAVHYLLAERLAMTLAKTLPDAVPAALLKDQRGALFGPPMQAGGVYKELMETLDELAYLQLRGEE